MITERRGVRRGMTVLGKIPVPRPVNLPSQRLENRGLDPNVEIVPRGTVTWGNAARSPPTSTNNWVGSGSQPSSPPVSGGAWGSKPASAWGPNSSRPSSAGSTRPTSAGSSHPSTVAPRPSSAGGRHSEELARPSSAGNQEAPSQNAWGPPHRPSSSGAQANNQPPAARPRSAESRPNGRVSLLTTELTHTGPQPWGPSVARKQSEEMTQPSRFTLTTGDFPTLGSEKSPNLRPQQRDRPDERNDERPPSHQYEDGYSQGSRFNDPEGPNGWGRGPFRGPPGPGMEGGYWRREPPPDGEEHWPPGGPYVGPPRFPNPEFLHQRFGPGPPGSYGQPGDGYGPPPFMRPMNPERPGFGPGMFPGPYDGYYGYPPGYNMDERMWGGPAGYGGFHPDFPRHPMGPRPRHVPNHAGFGKEGEFHGEFRGENTEFRRETGNKLPGNDSKRPIHPRPHGQRDWGNEEPMDFSRPVFEKEQGTPPSKNHKVTFKAEPTVPDVAILKKPHPGKHDGESGDAPRNEILIKAEAVTVSSEVTHTEKDGSSTIEKLEEKVVLDMSAGVLGKAPGTIVEEKQGSPRIVKSDVTKHSSDEQPGKDSNKSKPKSGTHPSTHESEKEWRPKLQVSDLTPKVSRTEVSSPSPSVQDSCDVESSSDVYDYEAQRAKMKEIAAQRARQLQKEEEERIKEQKAKAMAKLEELNRRSAVVSTDPVVETTEGVKEADQVQFGTFQSGEGIQEVKPISSKPEHGRRGGKGSRSRKERSKGQGQYKKDVSIEENSSEQHISPSCVCPQPADTVETPRSDVVETRPLKLDPVETSKREGRVRSPTTQEDIQTDERGSSRGNGGKRFSRKPKRVSSKSQDVRVSDKAHAAETMIWAPVRNAPEQQPPQQPQQPQQSRPNSRNFHRQNSQDHRNKKSEFVESSLSQLQPEGSRPDGNRPDGNRPEGTRSRGGRERQHQNQQQGQNEVPRAHDATAAPPPSHPSRKQHNNHQAEARQDDAPQAEVKHPPPSRPHEKERHRDNGMVYQQKSGVRHSPAAVTAAALEGGGGSHQRPQSASGVGGVSHKHFSTESHHHKPHYQPIPQQQQQQQSQAPPPQQQHAKGHYDSWPGRPEHGSNSNWGSSHGGGGGGGGRRGRFGGGRGMRSVVDMGNRVEKQRMVIDATGGAVPNQVVG